MVSNSSSVPRLILRNNGMSPMPSGSRRQTSSVIPGRMVGLTIPTTPRQLENDMNVSSALSSAFPSCVQPDVNAPAQERARYQLGPEARHILVADGGQARPAAGGYSLLSPFTALGET